MRNLWKDFRLGARLMLRNPGFSALAVLVLSLGIGANTAIFTLVNNLVLRPAPFRDPDRLVGCFSRSTRTPDSYRLFSYPNYVDIRNQNTVFSDLLAHTAAMVGIREGDTTRRVFTEIVSSNYFKTLGVGLWKGRTFTSEEEQPGAAIPVVIVSYEYWRQAGQDPDFLGKTLWINGRSCTVVGIARQGFTGRTIITSSGVWLPLGMFEATANDFDNIRRPLSDRSNYSMFLVGRLKEGVSPESADSQLAVLSSQLAKAYPAENADQQIITHRLSRFSISSSPDDDAELAGLSLLLSFMAGLVLLIACFNLANMMLARATARRKEFAVRLALGSGRRRIISQLMAEGFLLSLLGAGIGSVLAVWGTRLLVYSLNTISPITLLLRTEPDIRVFAAMLAFALLSTVIFSLGPALKSSKSDLVTDLKECTGETAPGKRRHWVLSSRNLLVVGQLALSMSLLAAGGLFVRGAVKAAGANPGYSLDNGILAEVDAGLAGYQVSQGRDLYRRIEQRLSTLPGVESVSIAATVPFGLISLGQSVLREEDAGQDRADNPGATKSVSSRYNIVGSDYFRALGVRLLRGRTFTAMETASGTAPRVAIIDTALAQKLWPDGEPLGQHIVFRSSNRAEQKPPLEVIGIVPTLRDSLLGAKEEPHVYVPFGPEYQSDVHFHLRMRSPGPEAEAALLLATRDAIRDIDGRLPILGLKTLHAQLDTSLDLWLFRTGARLFSLLGGLALFLAVVGVYGLKAFTVARRTREIGIRMALGATVSDTVRMVLKEGLWLTLAGTAIGLALALAVGRLLSSLLYEVSPMDVIVFVTAPLVLIAISMLASYIPARRAARVDPMVALRYE